ncbi:MAG: 1,4-alpha-glucan branching protein GlgB [Christensenellales bacterium]|jgi:1,4-alpha-glucan branching enzyme
MKAIFDDVAVYLFNTGANFRAYECLGCHKIKNGYRFAVWAPNAKAVSLVGNFNAWDVEKNPMQLYKDTGVWYCEVEKIRKGVLYKYAITTSDDKVVYRADPYAFFAEKRPGTASRVFNMKGYRWCDAAYLKERGNKNIYESPMCIYEMHMGSWKGDGTWNYRQVADELVPYLVKMGYTHVEVMPVAEHPFDASWGYQVMGYYAATSRYGTPHDFMYFVDLCHQHGIGVILDWVPGHFPKDEPGLRRFDGVAEYEHEDPREGESPEWGTCVFNYGRDQVISFLISNAVFWIEEYHIDGLRVDAVSHMLYRDYGRHDGQWVANEHGGNENLEAIAFIQKLNQHIKEEHPDVLMIAEESTAWPYVTHPVEQGGLGFTFKWNMGFMNDMLEYMGMDSYFRKWNHDKLTFLMMYAFAENYILPFSHDEVVHGKKSMLDKMPGTYDEKFAQLRLLNAYQYAHPGKKLTFMGSEFGQFIEWRVDAELDWMLLEYDRHRQMQVFNRKLNHFYKNTNALYEQDGGWDGFEWLNHEDAEHSVISFLRRDFEGSIVVCVFNFTPIAHNAYRLGVPVQANYKEIFNSNGLEFGGDGSHNAKLIKGEKISANGQEWSVSFLLPAYTALFLKPNIRKISKKR